MMEKHILTANSQDVNLITHDISHVIVKYNPEKKKLVIGNNFMVSYNQRQYCKIDVSGVPQISFVPANSIKYAKIDFLPVVKTGEKIETKATVSDVPYVIKDLTEALLKLIEIFEKDAPEIGELIFMKYLIGFTNNNMSTEMLKLNFKESEEKVFISIEDLLKPNTKQKIVKELSKAKRVIQLIEVREKKRNNFLN